MRDQPLCRKLYGALSARCGRQAGHSGDCGTPWATRPPTGSGPGELLACPWPGCGSTDVHNTSLGGGTEVVIFCAKCGLSKTTRYRWDRDVSLSLIEEAFADWNRRAAPTPPAESGDLVGELAESLRLCASAPAPYRWSSDDALRSMWAARWERARATLATYDATRARTKEVPDAR